MALLRFLSSVQLLHISEKYHIGLCVAESIDERYRHTEASRTVGIMQSCATNQELLTALALINQIKRQTDSVSDQVLRAAGRRWGTVSSDTTVTSLAISGVTSRLYVLSLRYQVHYTAKRCGLLK